MLLSYPALQQIINGDYSPIDEAEDNYLVAYIAMVNAFMQGALPYPLICKHMEKTYSEDSRLTLLQELTAYLNTLDLNYTYGELFPFVDECGNSQAISVSFDFSGEFYECKAFFIAAELGHSDIVTALIARGVNLHFQGFRGYTALTSAAIRNDVNMFRQLFAGATLEEKLRAQVLAAKNGALDTLRILLREKLITRKEEVCQQSAADALQYAILNHHSDVVNELIAAGINVNRPGNKGITPLLLAAPESTVNVEMVAALIKAGANIHAKTKSGSTQLLIALDWAEMHQDHLMVELLKKHTSYLQASARLFPVVTNKVKDRLGLPTTGRCAAIVSHDVIEAEEPDGVRNEWCLLL